MTTSGENDKNESKDKLALSNRKKHTLPVPGGSKINKEKLIEEKAFSLKTDSKKTPKSIFEVT